MVTLRAADRDVEHVLHPFTDLAAHRSRGPMIIEAGHGVFVVDDGGKEYIEGIAGLWCTSLGFDQEELVEAAAAQMRRLPYYHSAAHKSTGPLIDLAERLKAIAPGTFSKVFFVSSGSEATETQIKLLWYYNNARSRPRKKKILSRTRAYHGTTLGAASLTGMPVYQRDFDLPVVPVRYLSSPSSYHDAEPGESDDAYVTRLVAELEATIAAEGAETIAAFIAEPVMAAGGVLIPPPSYFARVQEVLRAHDIRLIDDEVICGFGRTGRMWGADTFGLEPQSLSCAKALSSAYLPIGAVLIDEPMYDALVDQSERLGALGHGFTFGGHPTAAAVALRTLELMEERDVVGHVGRVAPRFQRRLAALGEHPLVGDARGVGLLGAVELVAAKDPARPFAPEAAVGAYCSLRAEHHGLICRALGDVVALCPPLVITDEEIDAMFDRLGRALDDTQAAVAGGGA